MTKLAATVRAIEAQPELAQFKFRARNEWDTGGHNVATVDTFYGAGQELEHKQPFMMDADEPPVLLGEDNGANPVEFVLAGLSGCMTTTLAYHAASRGLKLERSRANSKATSTCMASWTLTLPSVPATAKSGSSSE